MDEPGEDPSVPLGTKPKGSKPSGTKPKGAAGVTPKCVKPKESVPKNTAVMTPGGQSTWYKSGVAHDTRCTGPAAIPPENLLELTRKRKASEQPKSFTSGGPTAQKRKKTTPACWLPQTQPRTTYIMGNKITPVWGLINKDSMDPEEDSRVPIYQPSKLTDRQETARQEAKKKKLKYKRYRPGQLALKEIKYYHKKAGFLIPISAIRRICLENWLQLQRRN